MWRSFSCLETELNCKIVLTCGQSFRWHQDVKAPDTWVNVLDGRVWYLRQDAENVYYRTHGGTKKTSNDDESFLRDYFQLDVNVPKLYRQWSKVDKNFSKLQNNFCGIRMLRQDPVENLFSFICSQNNNIKRISQLVEKLCTTYGDVVATVDGVEFRSFPQMSALAGAGVEAELRGLGFGYRARFIHESAKLIEESYGGEKWLLNLRDEPYEEAHKQLLTLTGVGAKVADCVCLMSLDKPGAIPIDTHMWQIAVRDYLPHLKTMKTVTDRAYKEIGDLFRGLYGEYAGWGHSVLFSADLKRFEELKNDAKGKGTKRKSSKTNVEGGVSNKKKGTKKK